MKTINSIFVLAAFVVSAFVLTSSSCKSKCTAPSIVFSPSGNSITAAPGEKVNLTVSVTGSETNIKSLEVTKSTNGVTAVFDTKTGGGTGLKYDLVDSIPANVGYGSVFEYKFIAKSDCKDETASEMVWTVTVGPSSVRIEDSTFSNQGPRVYSRASVNAFNASAWQLEYKTLTGARFAADPNSEKDIRDSTMTPDPFLPNVRWGSRNGSKFKKAVGFNFGQASPKSIIDAWNNSGAALDIIPIAANDVILVNIKNSNRYAAVLIRSVVDNGTADPEDYTYFGYKLAQK